MSEHDEFCLCAAHNHPLVDDCGVCRCWLIAEVRADERRNVLWRVATSGFMTLTGREQQQRVIAAIEGHVAFEDCWDSGSIELCEFCSASGERVEWPCAAARGESQ